MPDLLATAAHRSSPSIGWAISNEQMGCGTGVRHRGQFMSDHAGLDISGSVAPDGAGRGSSGDWSDLESCMKALDRLIERALDEANRVYGPSASEDAFRGLHIDDRDIARLLASEPGVPHFHDAAEISDALAVPRSLRRIAGISGLDSFDQAVLIVAAAPELDLRYERFYAFLNDDVTRKRCTVDLALNLLCREGAEKVRQRRRFLPDAPLLTSRLLAFVTEDARPMGSMLSQQLRVHNVAVAALLGGTSLDESTLRACTTIPGADVWPLLPLSGHSKSTLIALADRARTTCADLHVRLVGSDRDEKRHAAAFLAKQMGRNLLHVDIGQLDGRERGLDSVFKQAQLDGALVFIEDGTAGFALDRRVLAMAAGHRGAVVLSDDAFGLPDASAGAAFAVLRFERPDFALRTARWRAALELAGLPRAPGVAQALAVRFRLTCGQSIATTMGVAQELRVPAARRGRLQRNLVERLLEGARSQTRAALDGLAMRIEPTRRWDDLVLAEDAVTQLREICNQFIHRHRVLEDWAFKEKLGYGTGITALFSGAPGTGKTMAAEIIAAELGLDLFRIELAAVVSKYIGETEKNLEAIFRAASQGNAVLFFDEADALFGKRSEVKDAHDRYANLEISYLLQCMERFDGLAILATNSRESLDAAFLRRLAFSVHFPVPDESLRRQLWRRAWPDRLPRQATLDLDDIAARFKLPGGNIKNVALAAAYFAAADGGVVTNGQVMRAIEREQRKLGKSVS